MKALFQSLRSTTSACTWTVLALLGPGSAGAQTWTLTQAPPVTWNSIACSADGSRFVAATGGSIWTSQDSGATWVSNNAPAYGWVSVASSADGSRLVAAAGGNMQGPIFMSVDGGTNWTKTTAPSTGVAAYWRSVACSANSMQIVAVTANQVYVSRDGGGKWAAVALPPPANWSDVASSADGTKLYVCTGLAATGDIRASTNAGATWFYTGAPYKNDWSSIACSANGSKVIAASTSTRGFSLYSSVDSGVTWAEKVIPVACREVAVSADGKKMIAVAWENKSTGLPGFVYASTDSGATWTDMTPPARNWAHIACSADGDKWVGAADVQTYVFERTPTPELAIRSLQEGHILSWTVPSKSFVLEENSTTTSPDWTAVSASPAQTNCQNQVVMPGNGEARFYRLRAQ